MRGRSVPTFLVVAASLAAVASVAAHQPTADATAPIASPQELQQAEYDAPHLAAALNLRPGMTVADVGAGDGAMTIVMSRWLGPSGRLFATDVTDRSMAALAAAKTRESLANVTILRGAAAATNLPEACCDGIIVRLVYHHVTQPAAFNRSLAASLRPGGRLAIIDAPPDPGSRLPEGVPANRGGHGVPSAIVEEELRAAGLVHVRTSASWPPGPTKGPSYLAVFRRSAAACAR